MNTCNISIFIQFCLSTHMHANAHITWNTLIMAFVCICVFKQNYIKVGLFKVFILLIFSIINKKVLNKLAFNFFLM